MQIKSGAISIPLLPSSSLRVRSLVNALRASAEYLVVIFASVVSFVAWRHYFDAGLILSYNDSMSHLDIARRVVEGLTPGFAQIGSVWLPLPHILMLPLIGSNFLWHSGLAGTIISSLAFIGATYFIYKLAAHLCRDEIAGLLAAIIFALNPNMSYMQAIPMTESLLIFLFAGSAYYLFRWQEDLNYRFLILAGFFTLLGALTRYDAWMLIAQMAVVILFVVLQKNNRWQKAESHFILFMTIALYGVILWFVWNKLIFGDWIYFANGPFSAKAQQLVFEAEGRLFSKGDILYSSYIYLLAVIKNNGAVFVLLSLVGSLVFLFKNKFNSIALAASLLLCPLVFNIAALYTGNSIINLPDLPPYTIFNARYGLLMLPAVAVFVAYLSRRQRLVQLLFLALFVTQTYFMYIENDIITVKDGISGASAQNSEETGRWLGKNADSGLIMIAASSQDSLIFQSGLPMAHFITEGTGKYWTESLADPRSHASWIAMHHGDLIYNAMVENPNFRNHYERVYDGEFTDIYQLVNNPEKPITPEEMP